ncbi:MAG: tRNA (N(6)-L-threonylcarbamoyladenosine(37)-C(2))-methylthiotransferase MtaB [Candidatus Aegiribacteria sp.]|nr:tRNA (N(6)-L-threonylcarbamoyladenosine(37)-C(2))-methylthiotransferase MtaB [Candidatus Aegiribacteria sp.]
MNAYETEALLEGFRLNCGIERADEPEDASIILVNSCAVTGRSTARSRKAVRYFLRRTDAVVIVTGCVAQVAPEEFGDQNAIIVPNTDKSHLVETIAALLNIEYSPDSTEQDIPSGALFPINAPEVISRTRAFLKIQDGCDNHCSYCIVPLARGRSRSQPRELVLSQAEKLASAGFREILLTGVDLVRYGNDLYGDDYDLTKLVRDLLSIGGFRVRLSSMEPIGLSSNMIKGIALPGVCRHMHIPIQSGSDRILRRMKRMYSKKDIIGLLDKCMELFPGLALGADIIVGFPGETSEDFQETVDLISHPAVTYLHVFPFSARPGTPAASYTEDMIHNETITERAVYLRSFSDEIKRKFRNTQTGKKALALVEARHDKASGRLIGMTDNYIPVLTPDGSREGELVSMIIRDDNICWDTR